MMELLKKFEEENGQDGLDVLEKGDDGEDEDLDDGTDLARRFQDIDLGMSRNPYAANHVAED